MNSLTVNSAIICYLLVAGSSHAYGDPSNLVGAIRKSSNGSAVQAGAHTAQAAAKTSFFAKGRIEIDRPSEPLKLGQKNEIPLRIRVPGITQLNSEQTGYHHQDADQDGPLVTERIDESIAELPILYHPDGSAYVELVPLRLGQVELDLRGRYPDGGLVKQSVMLDVELPSTPPQGIVVGRLGVVGKNHTIHEVLLNPTGGRGTLHVGAKYDDVHGYLPIDPQFVSFEVRNGENAPAIDFDKTTGSFGTLHVGDALVVSTFGGWTNYTCVVVMDKFDPQGRNRPPCASLLSPDEMQMMREEEMIPRK